MVKTLVLELGADKEAAAADGSRPLHKAAHRGHLAVVKAMVEMGVDKEASNATGARPLYHAAQEGHVAVVRALIELGPTKRRLGPRVGRDRCTSQHIRAMCQW